MVNIAFLAENIAPVKLLKYWQSFAVLGIV
jgi:hypothetical protein